ncbi:unnamed protein product [Fraxinus pennsylvanica]|uniref:Peptidase A1 domain-containing protein n=1 Tax=Fraxinus pennsylvanica TaxID=56036 RepID=A0AAD1ZTV0_9LAMI|nr:unnamed protein product [Fraxinus pennsylvanica]
MHFNMKHHGNHPNGMIISLGYCNVSYGDNSYSNGDLAADTLSFQSSTGKAVSFPKTTFGCGHENGGTSMKVALGSPLKGSGIDASSSDQGYIIIDSGTTLTFLPEEIYNQFESALVKAIKGKRVKDPRNGFNLCYQATGGSFDAPPIVAHFTGADVELPPTSTFLEIEEGMVCLTLAPSSDLAIYGNLSQMNYLVGYDLVNKKVSIKPTDCSKAA